MDHIIIYNESYRHDSDSFLQIGNYNKKKYKAKHFCKKLSPNDDLQSLFFSTQFITGKIDILTNIGNDLPAV